MATNPYFQSGRGIGDRNEQTLIEDLIMECIKVYGFDTWYLPRTLVKDDQLFLEDTLSKFQQAYPIEAYLENSSGFEGNDILSKFGIQMNDSGTFVIAKRRWEEAVGRSPSLMLPNRPAEGDLIYFPITNSYFEIKKVNVFNPFYQVGKLYVYKLEVELFQYSSERIETGTNIDDIGNIFGSLDVLGSQLLLETGDMLLAEEGTGSFIQEEHTLKSVDIQSDNEYFEARNDDIIDFSISNPFGDIVR